MIQVLQALLFGIVEGITEWLPISSTGHMMLLNQFMPLAVSDAFYATFLVVIQLGAIMAVVVLYFDRLNPFSRKKTAGERRETWEIWAKVAVGTVPAGVIGLLFDDLLEEKVMTNPDVAYIVVAAALIVYGIIFIVMERVPAANGSLGRLLARIKPEKHVGKPAAGRAEAEAAAGRAPAGEDDAPIATFADMGYGTAFLIGVFQSLAVIPGTSRSGSIIIGSRLLGTTRTLAAEFAFFLAIPVMLGWSVVKLIKHGLGFTGMEWIILGVGCVSAFVVSILVIRFLLSYVKRHDFGAFGVYRIVLAVLVLVWFGLIAA